MNLHWSLIAGAVLLVDGILAAPNPPFGDVDQHVLELPVSAPTTGAVASQESNCSSIGTSLLLRGGNAADAMVAATLCNGVTNMYHGGIGGGGFALVRAPNNSFSVIDFREAAPAAAHRDMYAGNFVGSEQSGLASGIPSELRGLQYLYEQYGSGRLSWKQLVEPSIRLAREGFRVGKVLADIMDAVEGKGATFLVTDPAWSVDFAPNGTRVGEGDMMTRERYAKVLQVLADKGPDAFYEGDMAEATIRALQERNGTMTLQDLQDYRVEIREPLEIDYRGHRIVGCGTPASGAVALGILKVLEGYDDIGSRQSLNLSTHRLDEATKFGYAMRSRLGDPDFVAGAREWEDKMLSDEQVEQIRGRIDDDTTHPVEYYNPDGFEILSDGGTTHIVAADGDGMAISLTTTVNLLFGSWVMVPETGVVMNNEMDDFSIPGKRNAFNYVPSPANYIRPGKRPLSSITPIITLTPSGELNFVTGAAGGSRIITSTLQSVWHVLDRGLSPAEALKEPRSHDQLVPPVVVFEHGYDTGVVESMNRKGHNITIGPAMTAVQVLRRLENGTFEAAAEPRQEGSGGFAV